MNKYQVEVRRTQFGYGATVINDEHRAEVNGPLAKTERGAISAAARLIRKMEAAAACARARAIAADIDAPILTDINPTHGFVINAS